MIGDWRLYAAVGADCALGAPLFEIGAPTRVEHDGGPGGRFAASGPRRCGAARGRSRPEERRRRRSRPGLAYALELEGPLCACLEAVGVQVPAVGEWKRRYGSTSRSLSSCREAVKYSSATSMWSRMARLRTSTTLRVGRHHLVHYDRGLRADHRRSASHFGSHGGQRFQSLERQRCLPPDRAPAGGPGPSTGERRAGLRESVGHDLAHHLDTLVQRLRR